MRRLVLAGLILIAPALFAQQIGISAEIPIAPPEIVELAGGEHPRVASDGTNFFAIWRDFRESGVSVVYGARFTPDGALLDPAGIRIGYGTAGDLIWTGRSYVAIVSVAASVSAFEIGSDGVVRSQKGLRNVYGSAPAYRLASNGETLLLVWTDGGAARLALDGTLLGQLKLDGHGDPAVAGHGSDFIVASTFISDIVVQRVSASGEVSAPRKMNGGPGYPTGIALASNGRSLLLVWTEMGVSAQELGGDLALIGPRRMLAPPDQSLAEWPRVLARGDGYFVAYAHNFGDVFAAETNARGEVLRMNVVAHGRFNDASPGAALANDTGAIVWVEKTGGVRAGVFAAQSLGTAKPLHAITPLARAARPQLAPKVADSGGGATILWAEPAGDGIDLRLTNLRGARATVARTKVTATYDVVDDGAAVWVVWLDGASYFVRRFTRALAPIDAQPRRFPTPQGSDGFFRVAGGDRGIAIGWSTFQRQREIVATVLWTEGSMVYVSEIALASEPWWDRFPAVAWSGSEFVVAWLHRTEDVTHFPQPIDEEVHAVRITREAVRIDPVPLLVHRRGPTHLGLLRAAPAHDGGVVLTWEDEGRTFATVFRGRELPPVREIPAAATEEIDQVVTLARGFLFVWNVRKQPSGTLRLQRVSNALEPEGESITIALPEFSFFAGFDVSAVAALPFVVYSRVARDATYGGVPRVFLRHGELR